MSKFLLVLTTVLFINPINCARILCVYPIPMISHQIVFRALTEELAKRGHELVVITTDSYLPKDRPQDNVTEIDLHDLSYSLWKKYVSERRKQKISPIEDFHNVLMRTSTDVFDAQLNTSHVKELLENPDEHFDLLIVESIVRPVFFFSHRFKAPVIAFSSLMGMSHNYDATGTPTNPLLYSNIFNEIHMGHISFWKKVEAIYIYLVDMYYYWKSAERENEVGRKHFGEDAPDIRELANNMEVLLLNVNQVWDGIRPAPPSVVYVGGLHIKPPKKLPKELQQYLDGCKRGVVYMSLGSNIKSAELSADRLRIFLRVFGEIPYCVLWKWESDELPGKPDNVKVAKWLPQMDLLAHPNIRAFITQGGLQSADETIEAEVPVIGIPFVSDQAKNVQRYVQHGVGIALSIDSLNEETLKQSILTIVNDDSYRQRMRRLKRLLRDQPSSALERAVWWVEHVLRHGGARHLRSPAAGASLYRYLPPDVLAALLAALLACSLLTVFALRAICSMLPRALFGDLKTKME